MSVLNQCAIMEKLSNERIFELQDRIADLIFGAHGPNEIAGELILLLVLSGGVIAAAYFIDRAISRHRQRG